MVLADFFIHGVVLVLWRLGAIVENGMGYKDTVVLQFIREVNCEQGYTMGV